MITITTKDGEHKIKFDGDTNELIRELQIIVREFAAHNPNVNPEMVALICGDALAEAVEINGYRRDIANIRGDAE